MVTTTVDSRIVYSMWWNMRKMIGVIAVETAVAAFHEVIFTSPLTLNNFRIKKKYIKEYLKNKVEKLKTKKKYP